MNFLKQKHSGAITLLYHRVERVPDSKDPLLLAVSPDNFRWQMSCLEKGRVKSLASVVAAAKKGKNTDAICLTFDDGYADNLEQALPILEEFNFPATVFVIAGSIGKSGPFKWNHPKVDAKFAGRMLSRQELKDLAAHPLIEIGAHTMTHPHLGELPKKQQLSEMVESKKILEDIIGKEVLSLAYPFGASEQDFTDQTKEAASEAGYEYGTINIPGKFTARTDPFDIPRVLVRNWEAPEFRLKMEEFEAL